MLFDPNDMPPAMRERLVQLLLGHAAARTGPEQHAVMVVYNLAPGEPILEDPPTGNPHLPASLRIVEQQFDLLRQIAWISRLEQQTCTF